MELMTSQNLKISREKNHLSQSKIAKLLNVHPAVVSSWESGKVLIPASFNEILNRLFNDIDQSGVDHILSKSGIRIYKKKKYNQQNHHIDDGQQALGLKDIDSVANLKKVKLDKTKPKAIALFAGCGGMSLGLKQSGFQIVGYAEIEEKFRSIYAANFSNSALLGSDVCNITNEEIRQWKENIGDVDLLAGGPPCQGFSLAGKRDVLDPRNRLYLDYLRIAEHLKPKVVLMENVRLLTTMKTPDGFLVKDDIKKKFEAIGYKVSINTINAKDYGVPQSRARVVFIAVRNDLNKEPGIPSATHGEKTNLLGLPSYVTFRDATADLELLESGEKSKRDPWHFAIKHPLHILKMLKDIPEGESAHNHPNPLMRPKSGFNTTYKRIVWDEPSSTITTNFSMISGSRNVHPTNTRSLTIREAARCQTFPDEFNFVGKMGSIRASIGNAVPPHLARIFGEYIKNTYLTKPEDYKNNPLSN